MKEVNDSHTISEELLSLVLEQIEEGILLADKSRKVFYSNSSARKLLARSHKSLSGEDFLTILSVNPTDPFFEDIVSDKGIPHRTMRFLKNSLGLDLMLEVKVNILKDPGDATGYSILLKDVTERETYTIKLEKSERKYRGLFQNIQEGILIMNDDSTIVDVNPAACQIYNLSKEGFTGLRISDLFPHKSEEETTLIWQEFIKTGKINGFYKYFINETEFRYIDFKARSHFIPGFHLAIFTDVTEKRKTEASLRISESQLNAIFESTNQRIVLTDLELNIIRANKNARDICRKNHGVELDLGFSIKYFNHNEELSKKSNAYIERVKKGEQIIFDVNAKPKDPNYWIEVIISPVFDERHQVKYLCFTVTDISYRKKAEISLAESEARFRSLVQNSSDIIAILGQDFDINYVSSSILKVLQYNEDSFEGKNLLDYVFPEDLSKVKTVLETIAKEPGSQESLEFRLLHAEGYYVFLETVFNNQKENPYINGIILNARDITDRKFQEESLLLLERAIDSSENGIIITDPNQIDNPVIYTNKAFEKITGYGYLEIIGKNCRILQGKDTGQPELKKIRKAVKEESGVSIRIKNYRKDGTLFWNDLTISPVFNRQGVLTNYIGVLNDVTERKLVEDTLLEISRGAASFSEKHFFESLVQHLAFTLHLDSVMIAEVMGNQKVITKAFIKDGVIRENAVLARPVTATDVVISKGKSLFIADLKEAFPKSRFTKEGYLQYFGIPLFASNGAVIGAISAFNKEPINNLPLAENLLNLFSVRTAAELEHEQYLEALEASETRFRSLAENSPDIILIVNLHTGKVTYYNRKTIFGYKIREIENTATLLRLIHPEDRKRMELNWVKLLSGKQKDIPSDDYRVRKKKGHYEWIASRQTVLNKDEESSRVLVNLSIITERKNAEQALKESEDRLLALIENTNDLLWSTDKDLNFTTMNSSFQKVFRQNFGGSVKIGQNITKALPEPLKEEWLNNHRKALEGNRFTVELTLKKGTKENSYEISYNPIFSIDNTITGVSVFGRDITLRKNAEMDIIRTNFELDSFVYRASHDLRAPLRSVLGLVNLVKIEKNPVQAAHYLNLMDKSIAKLDNFIADLTNFSRNSRMEISVRKLDFNLILEESLEHLKFMDKADRIRIIKDLHLDIPFYSDPTRISIITQNLISNAIKYQNENRMDSFCKISIFTFPQKAEIMIEDNGKGIKEEYLDRVFNMFFRASHDSYGSGLGLYITRQVVDKLGGSISVNSRFGIGTQFLIILPNVKIR